MKKPSTPSKASAVSRGNDLGFLHPKQPATFFNDYPSPCGGGMPPCGSDGSLPSRPQWTALFDLFDIVLSVFECIFFSSLKKIIIKNKKIKKITSGARACALCV